MSLDKSIEHGKEKRRKFRGAKSYDSTCCNHGGCDSCENNRTHNSKKRKYESEYECEDCYDTGCVCGGIGYSCWGCCHCHAADYPFEENTARDIQNET